MTSKKKRDAGVFDDAVGEDNDGGNDTGEDLPTSTSKRQRTSKEDIDNSDGGCDNVFDDAESATKMNGENDNSRFAGLSKFVRRILDPNRKPRGLIEPPSIIPLNDEFLLAFGRREKEFDAQLGHEEDIDHAIVDDEDDDDANDTKNAAKKDTNNTTEEKGEPEGERKVKFANLRYTTSARYLEEECLNFGPVTEVNMIMDDSDPDSLKNIGRAYVLFQYAKDALACVDQQCGGTVDGRNIRVSFAEQMRNKGGGSKGGQKNSRDEKRYYQKDVSTKCFRCGQVGHMAAECPNPAKANVCPLCARANEHDMRACPLNRICFNCGIPGHINRECPVPRGSQPPRQICSICCGSGHSRFQCQRFGNTAGLQEAAVCGVDGCNKTGHYMCQELKWFFGLEGIYCYNCGGKGHVGNQCNRPNLDDLGRNDGWATKEMERAEEYKLCVTLCPWNWM